MESRDVDLNKSLGVDLKWIVADRVVAAWEDETNNVHFLGRLSSHNKTAEFSLLLGHSPEDKNACVLLFHLPIRLRAGSATKPTDLFLVLPLDTFRSLAVTTANKPEIPASHLDTLTSTGLNDSTNAIRLAFRLREPGYVLMPRIKIKHELLGTPQTLLLTLRSFSQATSFDVYLKRNTYSQVALNDFCAALLQGSTRMSQLRLKSMYQGRGAKQDAWELFGLDPNSSGPRLENEGCAPPSYKKVVKTLVPSTEPAQGTVVQSATKKAPEGPQTPDASACGSVSFVEETPTSRKRAFAEAESPTASDTEAEAELRKKSSKSMLQLPLFADGSGSIPASPPLIERPHSSPPTTARLSAPKSIPSVRPISPSQHELSTNDLLREIATWMQDGWAIDLNVHQKLLLPLLALGYQAHQRNLPDFDLAKGRCTSLLYIRLATQGIRDAVEVIDVEEDMAHLIAWANGSVFRGAESVLREETALLGTAAARACEGGFVAKEEYLRQKALWVAHVLVCFGTMKDVETLTERRFEVA